MKPSHQSLFTFELTVVDAELAATNARIQAKLAAAARERAS